MTFADIAVLLVKIVWSTIIKYYTLKSLLVVIWALIWANPIVMYFNGPSHQFG